MTSTFIGHHTRCLLPHLQDPFTHVHNLRISNSDLQARRDQHLNDLRALLSSLKAPLDLSSAQLRHALARLEEYDRSVPTQSELEEWSFATQGEGVKNGGEEEDEVSVLKRCIQDRILLGLYAESLDCLLTEAIELEAEATWWADIERSRRRAALYLLQSFPLRLFDLTHTVFHTLRSRGIPIRPALFTPWSLRRLFPSPNSLQPNLLLKAAFPHLDNLTWISTSLSISSPTRFYHYFVAFFCTPVELARQECRLKRQRLQGARDQRAEALGALVQMRDVLITALKCSENRHPFIIQLKAQISHAGPPPSPSSPPSDLVSVMRSLANGISRSAEAHRTFLEVDGLLRPSRLTLLWPRILLIPPLLLYTAKTLYASRESLAQVWDDARQTAHGFVKGWLIEPLKEVLKTVRAGGEEGVIVRKEGVNADFDSLERMTLSLARDELRYDAEQLRALSEMVRVGDLTPVLRIYEEDIRTPLKSAVTGTLLRSVFIQVQKAKVDIDQTLAGIDKLLKSQELTFAFVGVAPALTIVYILGGGVIRFLGTGRQARYGGFKRRKEIWLDMRRIERLLISQPHSSSPLLLSSTPAGIPPLTAGLLMLSLTRLRSFAITALPARSLLQDRFLEDVQDLEDPGLGRAEKLRVVDRMWRCWGGLLGWGRAGDEGRL